MSYNSLLSVYLHSQFAFYDENEVVQDMKDLEVSLS